LQDKDSLRRILSTLKEIDDRKPLLVKIAPDLTLGAIEDAVSVAIDMKLAGMVCTNTTVSREMLLTDPGIEGGLSGEPLREMADEVLKFVRETAGDRLALIGVGGVMSPEDAKRKMDLGADLVQVYTGWVYNGPRFIPRILDNL
jgi:dihydroorotate dehydrogenase